MKTKRNNSIGSSLLEVSMSTLAAMATTTGGKQAEHAAGADGKWIVDALFDRLAGERGGTAAAAGLAAAPPSQFIEAIVDSITPCRARRLAETSSKRLAESLGVTQPSGRYRRSRMTIRRFRIQPPPESAAARCTATGVRACPVRADANLLCDPSGNHRKIIRREMRNTRPSAHAQQRRRLPPFLAHLRSALQWIFRPSLLS